MNSRDAFELLVEIDPVFRKKVVAKAASFGMTLYTAANKCAADETASPALAPGPVLTPNKARKQLEGNGRYHHEGSRADAIERNEAIKKGILAALKRGPATTSEIRTRIPEELLERVPNPAIFGNMMTALKAGKNIKRKAGKGTKSIWTIR